MRQPVVHVRFRSGRLVLGARWATNGHAQPQAEPDPPEGPGDFLRRHLEHELARDFGRSWDELHPADQRIVSRVRYAECRSRLFERAGATGTFASFDVLDVYDEPVESAAIPESTSKASHASDDQSPLATSKSMDDEAFVGSTASSPDACQATKEPGRRNQRAPACWSER